MTDPTPPRAADHQEREALAKIIDDNRWAPLECGVVRRTPPRELADVLLAAGFRRRAPEPVREERRWENLRDCDACNGTGYVPLAQPEPQQQGGEGKATHVNVDGRYLPLAEALARMTDDWVDGGQYCAQTVIDLRNALRERLAAPAPAAPAGVTEADKLRRLLARYVMHVRSEEGIDFLDWGYDAGEWTADDSAAVRAALAAEGKG